jgi:DNA-binding NtrC family response regulator
VRELENVIGHAAMMTLSDTIDISDLPPYFQAAVAEEAEQEPMALPSPGVVTLEDQEKQLLVRALEAAGGNQSKAARMLRIGRDALRYKMKKHNLDTPDSESKAAAS